MKRLLTGMLLLLGLPLVAGCNSIHEKSDPMYEPLEPIDYDQYPQPEVTGSVYQEHRTMSLFEDVRAHDVGDIVSVILFEATDASKSSGNSLDKTSDIGITNPTVFGNPVTIKDGQYDLSVSAGTENTFSGSADSTQSNSLTGSIAVQVASILPNGNLYVRGEKWIKINQGDEYIRLRGIIRPADLSPTNTIPSTLVADARISYSGTGPANEANTPGWLTRFFMSPLMPF